MQNPVSINCADSDAADKAADVSRRLRAEYVSMIGLPKKEVKFTYGMSPGLVHVSHDDREVYSVRVVDNVAEFFVDDELSKRFIGGIK